MLIFWIQIFLYNPMLHQFRTIGGFGIHGNNCSIEGLVALLFLQRNSRSWTWKTFTNKGMHIIVMSIECMRRTYVLQFKHTMYYSNTSYICTSYIWNGVCEDKYTALNWQVVVCVFVLEASQVVNTLYIWQINVNHKLSNVNDMKSARPSLTW